MWNAAPLARACRASLAGFTLVVLPASLAQATYGPRTTIGSSYQQTSDTLSVNGVDQGSSCNGISTVCYVLFQQAPQQRPLIVQHVSCRMQVTAGELRSGHLAVRKGGTLQFRHTYLVPVHTTGNFFIMNSPVLHLVKSGQRVVIQFWNTVTGNWLGGCNISGKLQQP